MSNYEIIVVNLVNV